MRRLTSCFTLISVLFFSLQLASADTASPVVRSHADQPIVAVVSIAGYDRVSEDVDLIGQFAEMPALRNMLEGGFAMFAGGNGLNAVDGSRPWGFVLYGKQLNPLAFIPAANADSIVNAIKSIAQAEATPVDDDIFELSINGTNVYLKKSNEWVFAAVDKSAFATLPTQPESLLGEMPSKSDIAIRAFWENIPQSQRQMVLHSIKQNLPKVSLRSSESIERFEQRQQACKLQNERLMQSIEDLDYVTAALNIQPSGSTTVDVVVTPKADSQFAKQQSIPAKTSRFSHVRLPKEFGRFALTHGPSEEVAEWLSNVLQANIEPLKNDDKELAEQHRQVVDKFTAKLTDTARTSGIDLALSMDVTQIEKPVGLGAFFVEDAKSLKEIFTSMNLYNDDKKSQMERFSGKDALRVSSQSKKDTLLIVFDENSVYVAMGNEAERELKQLISQPVAAPKAGEHWAKTSLSMYHTLKSGMAQDPGLESVRPYLDNLKQNGDLSVTLAPAEDGTRVRFELEENLLKVLCQVCAAEFQKGFAEAAAN